MFFLFFYIYISIKGKKKAEKEQKRMQKGTEKNKVILQQSNLKKQQQHPLEKTNNTRLQDDVVMTREGKKSSSKYDDKKKIRMTTIQDNISTKPRYQFLDVLLIGIGVIIVVIIIIIFILFLLDKNNEQTPQLSFLSKTTLPPENEKKVLKECIDCILQFLKNFKNYHLRNEVLEPCSFKSCSHFITFLKTLPIHDKYMRQEIYSILEDCQEKRWSVQQLNEYVKDRLSSY